jgi:adiponectin receptor
MAFAPRLRVALQEPEVRKGWEMEDDAFEAGSEEAGRSALVTFDDMPQWFREDNNESILHDHRAISGSVGVSFRSL